MSVTLAPGATDAADLTSAATTMQAVALSLGAYSWSTGVVVGNGSALDHSTVQNVEIAGEVGGASDSVLPVSAGALITYTGAPTAGAMLDAEGPIRIGLRNLTLDAVSKAAIGLDLKHVLHGTLADVNMLHATDVGIRQSAYVPLPANTYANGALTVFDRVAVSMLAATGAKAFYIGNGIGGTSRCAWYDCTALTGDDPTSAGFVLGFTDNIVLYNPFAYSAGAPSTGRRSVGLLIKPQAGGPAYPSEVNIYAGVFLGGIGLDASEQDWRPDTNGGRGLGFWPLNDGDMNDPDKNLWPESKNLGGREGINGFTSTAVQLDRHQPEVYRDRFISYGLTAPQPFRKKVYTPVTGTTTPTTVWSATLPPNYLRVFDRMPHANAYLNDRQIEWSANLSFYNYTGSDVNARVKVYAGPTGGPEACFFDSDNLKLLSDIFYRRGKLVFTIQNRGTTPPTQFVDGEIQVFKPGSGGGGVAKDIDIWRGLQKSGLALDPTVENVIRVEMSVSNTAAIAAFNFGKAVRI